MSKKSTTKGIYKRGVHYWIRYAGPDKKMIYESVGSSKFKDAESLLLDRKTAVRDGKMPEIRSTTQHTFKELAAKYVAWMNGRHRSAYSKKFIIDDMVRLYGNLTLQHFNTILLEQYQNYLMGKGLKPGTVNKDTSMMKAMLKKAVDWNMMSEETLRQARKVKNQTDQGKRLRYLSNVECAALLQACETYPYLKAVVQTALNTGMRRGEILNLRWDNVDMRHGFIMLDRTKNGDRREIPINCTLRGVFQGLTRRIDVAFVFYDPDTGKAYQGVKRSFGNSIKKTEWEKCLHCSHERQKTELQRPENCPDCGGEMRRLKGLQDFRFHDLRHTFASHLVMAGVDITTVSRLLGHKTLTMTLRYAHLAPAHLTSAVELLDKQLHGMATIQKLYNSTKGEFAVSG